MEWDARNYNQISTLQRVLAEEHLALIKLKRNARLLDIGCGDGKVTATLARRIPDGEALGIDPSEHMIDFARSHFPTGTQQPVRFEVGDARYLPYRDEFDLVVSFNALHWVREQDQVLKGVRQSLRPGGRAVLEFVPGGDPASLENIMEEVRRRPHWAKYFATFENPFHHFLPNQYRQFAIDAGLAVHRLQVEHGRWDFGNRRAFAGFVHGTLSAWVRRVPERGQDEFIGDVLNRYSNRGNTLHYLQMVVELRKGG